ncbi:hypothetical protein ACLB2K_013746 [Fragaria x ananassa]
MATMAAKLMHALQYAGYGGGPSGLKHVEVPIPTPKNDEVLLNLEAATINPIDWKVQKGLLRCAPFCHESSLTFLILIRSSFLTVPSAGTNDSTSPRLATPSRLVTSGRDRPPEVSAAEGAGLPVAGLTAHQCVTEAAGVKLDGTGPQKNILVTAASGGVGTYAVQLAKLGNTHVTATCGARNIEFIKSLGADEVLVYKTPEGEALHSPSGRKYDAVIHCTTGIPWSTFEPNLSPNGKVIDITPSPTALLTFALKKLTFSKKQLVPLIMNAKAENLDYLVRLVKEGKLKIVIDSKYPLSKAEEAWGKSIDGHATGKIIVEP